jgi:DNA-binding beta-propeller fold protein YncE
MIRRRNLIFSGALVAAVAALGIGQSALEAVVSQQSVEAPRFQVDPFWPKPLPNGWVLGTVIGVDVDANDNVYIVHRVEAVGGTEAAAAQDPPLAECCRPAPPVLQFDPEGNVVRAWGGPSPTDEYVWPQSNHGIAVDDAGNVWIGGNGQGDSHVVVFTNDGRYLRTYGEPGQQQNSLALNHFGRVADIEFDLGANEAYFADGYLNRRVAVVDITSGEIKRFWGAYGEPPNDDFEYAMPRPQTNLEGTYDASVAKERGFRGPVHCADPSVDGLVYVCDRGNARLQVFSLDGTYQTEAYYNPHTVSDGPVWDVAFSNDPEQTWMYVADGENSRIHIVRRATMETVGTFGTGGRYPGMLQAAHSIASDSQGNVYVTETYEGRRLHKFVFMGIGNVPRDQGATWPQESR